MTQTLCTRRRFLQVYPELYEDGCGYFRPVIRDTVYWDLNENGQCDLTGEDLSNDGFCSVTDCRIQGCVGECAPVILTGASYYGMNLANSIFSHAILTGADFSHATVSNVDFTYADLAGANFGGAYASASSFVNANCRGVNFYGANLAGARFNGAILSGVIWKDTICPDGVSSWLNGTKPESCVGHLNP